VAVSQTIRRQEIGRSVRFWSIAGIAYVILSAVCFVVINVGWLAAIFKSAVDYLWILGPPANLLYQTNFLPPYVVGTAGFFLLFAGGLRVRQPAIAWRCSC
jgi:hypothetical protein